MLEQEVRRIGKMVEHQRDSSHDLADKIGRILGIVEQRRGVRASAINSSLFE
jgi:hypothetical protein